jgi:uncharacterized membrane protein
MDGNATLGAVAVAAVAATALLMRLAGYLAARVSGLGARGARVVHLATGNLLVTVAAVAALRGGWPFLLGALAGALVARLTGREWAGLAAGASVAATAAVVLDAVHVRF